MATTAEKTYSGTKTETNLRIDQDEKTFYPPGRYFYNGNISDYV